MKSEAPSVSTATAGAVASAGASAGAPLSPSSPSSPPKRQAARPMKSTIQVRIGTTKMRQILVRVRL